MVKIRGNLSACNSIILNFFSRSNQAILDIHFSSFNHIFAIIINSGIAACVKHAAIAKVYVTPQIFFFIAIFFWKRIISELEFIFLFVCLTILWRPYEYLSDLWGQMKYGRNLKGWSGNLPQDIWGANL